MKIPSGEITNLPYLEEVAKLRTPVLLSTGMSTLGEITDALGVLDDNGCPEATILHCNTQYPTPYEDANLTAMMELFDQFGLPVGLSDHTPGWECDVAAAVLGAQVIEKHFTLDKTLPGPDQKASLDPAEFKAMVDRRAPCRSRAGRRHKHLTASEAPNKAVARKSIVAARAIQKGEVFTADNLTTKRPGDGVSPMRWYEVLGQTAKTPILPRTRRSNCNAGRPCLAARKPCAAAGLAGRCKHRPLHRFALPGRPWTQPLAAGDGLDRSAGRSLRRRGPGGMRASRPTAAREAEAILFCRVFPACRGGFHCARRIFAAAAGRRSTASEL